MSSTDRNDLQALQAVFAYATENFRILDDSLFPPLSAISKVSSILKDKGLAGLTAEDAQTFSELAWGLGMQNARDIEGSHTEKDYEVVVRFGQSLKGQGL